MWNKSSIIDTSLDTRERLPATEKLFEDFLNSAHIRAKRQIPIYDCPFVKNKKGEHKVDYRIERSDKQTLSVEVKGILSYHVVSQLLYMVEEMKENVYVFQVTNEDWLSRCKASVKPKDKIAENVLIQEQDIKDFCAGKKSASELNKLTGEHLREYVRTRSSDVEIWREMKNRKARVDETK